MRENFKPNYATNQYTEIWENGIVVKRVPKIHEKRRENSRLYDKDMDLSPEDYREALKALWGNVEVHKPEPQEDKQEKPEGTWNE